MSVVDFWDGLFGGLAISLSVSFLAGIFFIYGRGLLAMFGRQDEMSGAYCIAFGMFLLSFAGWYLYRMNVPLANYIAVSLMVGALLFLWQVFKWIRMSGLQLKLNFVVFPILSFLLAIQSQVGFENTAYSIGTLGNNDIFDWSILSSYLLGQPGYDNVMTTLGGAAQQYRIDSFGTFFIMGIFSKYYNISPVHISTYFTIFSMAAIGYAIYGILNQNLKIESGKALLVSFIVCSSSFSFYLAYNNFYGQLLATFFFLVGVFSILHVSDINWAGYRGGLVLAPLLIIPGVAGILVVYQSGFVVFVAFLISLAIISLALKFREAGRAGGNEPVFFYPVIPLFISILVALLIFPELSKHMIYRTIDVKSALNGWPLPLVSPEYLISLPVLKPFGMGVGRPLKYVVFFLVAGFLFWTSYKFVLNSGIRERENTISLILLFLLSVVLYLLAYLIKGEIYQVWKFASFVVLPLGFAFYIAFVSSLEAKIKDGRGQKVAVFVLILAALVNTLWMPNRYRLISLNDEVRQLELVGRQLEKESVKNVVLYGMGYAETMLAFNVLSPVYKVYPMVATYVQPVNDEVIGNLPGRESLGIISAACAPGEKIYADKGYQIVELDTVLAGGLRRQFGTKNADKCGAKADFIEGFSVIEPWGIWTEGHHSEMIIELRDDLKGKDIVLELEMQQFGKNQNIEILFYGQSVVKKISGRTVVPLKISSKNIENGKVRLEFNISTPLSPNSIDPSSPDHRKLGIGFVSYYAKIGPGF